MKGRGNWVWRRKQSIQRELQKRRECIWLLGNSLKFKMTQPLPGASTWDPTHDKVMREKTWQARRIRFSGVPKRPAHEIPPMTKSRGESLTGEVDHVFRDFEKLPLALTLKMVSVFLMPASIDYSLISVTRAEGLPRSLSKQESI